jgi:hypothetical protein
MVFQALRTDIDLLLKRTVENIIGPRMPWQVSLHTWMTAAYLLQQSATTFLNDIGYLLEHSITDYHFCLAGIKCRFLGMQAHKFEDPLFHIELDGEVIMGCPTGSDVYCLESARLMINDIALP